MSFRLTDSAPGFGRPAIDRRQPLSFRLDGVEIAGFAGDTVLSAALASGIAGAGRIGGAELRLGPEVAPNVRLWEKKDSAGVPMALCPAAEGLDLMTVGTRGGAMRRLAAQMFNRPRLSLGVDFGPDPTGRAVDDRRHPTKKENDLLVIGGGVAGMAAALAGAERGLRVVLVEQRGRLGGDASLFGNREGEDPVLEVIAALETTLAARPEIEVRRLCRAIDAGDGGVTVNRVADAENDLVLEAEHIKAKRIVLATGCADRLPVFPGNRLPGVLGLAEAFDFAGAYGVWPQGPTLFAGGTNALYHLALLAKDAGAEIRRLVDHRPSPHSRFIDFAKAMGVPQEFGTRVSAAVRDKDNTLAVETALALFDNLSEGRAMFAAGSIIQSDGWRPRLTLWTRLGGRLKWCETGSEADGRLVKKRVALAGSVTGHVTTSACRQSGTQAIAALFGDKTAPIAELRLADYIESPDAPPLGALPSAGEPAFLASSRVFVAMPVAAGETRGLGQRRSAAAGLGPAAMGVLDHETLDVLTRTGQTPAERFLDICAERLVSPTLISAGKLPSGAEERSSQGVPAYLAGRFGDAPIGAVLRSEDGRMFEPGMLVFADSGEKRPEQAIGVVLAGKAEGGTAVLAAAACQADKKVSLRDGARPLAATIVL